MTYPAGGSFTPHMITVNSGEVFELLSMLTALFHFVFIFCRG